MKMNQTWKKHGINIQPGTVIHGKWHKNHYTILKKIGEGAVGSVYLCESNGHRAALKISEQNHSMTVEVNVLQSLKKVQENRLGPYLLDTDDWVTAEGAIYSFYVMEYVHGENMASFIKRKGTDWIGVFLFQLLDDLDKLHRFGWVFGDLKLDNLIVVNSPPKVRFIDVGGTTKRGRAIKEFTEFYDRGYWGLGSRQAEPSYDLFALVMVFLHVFYPNEFPKEADPSKAIMKRIRTVQALKPYRTPFQRAMLGHYQTGKEMKQDVTHALHQWRKKRPNRNNLSDVRRKREPWFLEFVVIIILATLFYAASLLI